MASVENMDEGAFSFLSWKVKVSMSPLQELRKLKSAVLANLSSQFG